MHRSKMSIPNIFPKPLKWKYELFCVEENPGLSKIFGDHSDGENRCFSEITPKRWFSNAKIGFCARHIYLGLLAILMPYFLEIKILEAKVSGPKL